MPLTDADLLFWEKEKDVDKFQQIIKYLKDEKHRSVWSAAVEALIRIHTIESIYPLLLANMDIETSATANNLAPFFRRKPDNKNFSEAESKAMAALCEWGTEAIQPLCHYALDTTQSTSIRMNAFEIIKNYEDPCVYETYLNVLQNDNWVSKHIIEWINQMNSLEPVIKAITDKDPVKRRAAIKALSGDYKNKQAWELVITTLKDKYVQVRATAIKAIWIMLDNWNENEEREDINFEALVIAPLILASQDEDFYIRELTAICLKDFKDIRAMIALNQLVIDEDETVREAAVDTLSSLKFERVFDLLSTIYFNQSETIEIRRSALESIIKLSDNRVNSFLIDMIQREKDNYLRKVAIQGVGELMIQEGMDPLLKIIKEDDREIALEALRSLENLKNPLTIDDLLGIFDQEEERSFIIVYIRIFLELKDRRTLEPMIKKLEILKEEEVEYIAEEFEGILAPESFLDYLDNLTNTDNALLLSGVQLLKHYLVSKNKEDQDL